mmetsp:Transcript_6018/g.21237  ORF Transcript_6018/g.21237 Transcript_6018/m.21237 type:complete len:206 (+) Transcript_6018:397-1014(+)
MTFTVDCELILEISTFCRASSPRIDSCTFMMSLSSCCNLAYFSSVSSLRMSERLVFLYSLKSLSRPSSSSSPFPLSSSSSWFPESWSSVLRIAPPSSSSMAGSLSSPSPMASEEGTRTPALRSLASSFICSSLSCSLSLSLCLFFSSICSSRSLLSICCFRFRSSLSFSSSDIPPPSTALDHLRSSACFPPSHPAPAPALPFSTP